MEDDIDWSEDGIRRLFRQLDTVIDRVFTLSKVNGEKPYPPDRTRMGDGYTHYIKIENGDSIVNDDHITLEGEHDYSWCDHGSDFWERKFPIKLIWENPPYTEATL